jgi:hypothetical protein
MLMMLSGNQIAGVSRLLSVALRNGASPEAICDRLQQAISGAYRPHADWTDREFDIAFLVKSLGGPRLLYALQRAEGYPSLTTLRRHKHIPELTISSGTPARSELEANINAFLGEKGRAPPKEPRKGLVLLMDGVAIDEAVRLEFAQNKMVGICREHSGGIEKTVNTVDDIYDLAKALKKDKTCHYAKEATVVGLASITDKEDYDVVPLCVCGSCKTETADDMQDWVKEILSTWKASPNGEKRHGPIYVIATDGESSFRKLRYTLCLSENLDPNSEIGKIIYSCPGVNTRTGPDGILGTCDPKHIIKRFATMLRSSKGIQLGQLHITREQISEVLCLLDDMPKSKAALLLDPQDKQNVPKAVKLLQSLFDLNKITVDVSPAILHRFRAIAFISKVISYFLFPFISVDMSLAEQIKSLSTYSHLVTALHRKHHTGFMSSALIADSQSIVKNILFTAARLQVLDPTIDYYILQEGTDRLEGVFSQTRTQDHSRNFDIRQLAQKLSIGAEINAIFQRHPDLDRGHIRRNLVNVRGIDHINPKSWIGNVCVGDVDIPAEYLGGRDNANALLADYFGFDGCVDWDQLFQSNEVDHLRPEGVYVGSSAPSHANDHSQLDDDDNDHGLLDGGILDPFQVEINADQDNPLPYTSEVPRAHVAEADNNLDMRERTETSLGFGTGNLLEPDIQDTEADGKSDKVNDELEDFGSDLQPGDIQGLNPSALRPHTTSEANYLIYEGKREHKASLVDRLLGMSSKGRKATDRLSRVQGITIEASLRTEHNPLSFETYNNEDNKVKVGDLGGTLVRIGKDVCLALVEALNFQQGTSKATFAAIDTDDLDNTNKKVTVAVQILQLLPGIPTSTASSDFAWTWPEGQYVQIQDHKKGGGNHPILQRHFSTRIPGHLFHPIAPDIIYNNERKPVWSIKNSELKETLDNAWSSLNPESDEIITHVQALPVISIGNGLPYTLQDISQLYLPGMAAALCGDSNSGKLRSDTSVECRLCTKSVKLNQMRRHVGEHILHSRRLRSDPTLLHQTEVRKFPILFESAAHSDHWIDLAECLWLVRPRQLQDTNNLETKVEDHIKLRISLHWNAILTGSKIHRNISMYQHPTILSLVRRGRARTTELLEV